MARKRKKKKPTIEERIDYELEKWGTLLGLKHWAIQYELVCESEMEGDYGYQAAAQMYSMYPYLRSRVHFNREFICKVENEQLSDIVLHELVHVMHRPTTQVIIGFAGLEGQLMKAYKEAEEGVTDHVAAVLWNLRDWKGLS